MRHLSFVLGAALLFTAATAFAQTLPEGVTQAQMDAALQDISALYGSPVVRPDQAKAICNQEQYFVECGKIGQKHGLFSKKRAEQVDALLTELKGKVLDELKQCGSAECLVNVATAIAKRLSAADPGLARDVDLTPQKVEEKHTIVEIAKSAGVDIEECRSMDPDTASVELLRSCAKLARQENIQKYIPAEDRDRVNKSESTTQLKEALARGEYSCGDGTIEGCGAFCLNPTEAREGASAIPPVCQQIATRFFGDNGVQELERAHKRVQETVDTMQRFVERGGEGREGTSTPRRMICPTIIDYSPCPSGQYRQESVNEFGCWSESACIPLNTKTEPPPIDKHFICPSLPTVDSCPDNEEKVTSFTSPECGSYFACRPKQKQDTAGKYPHTFKSGRIVVSFEETRIYCFESGTNGATLRGDKTECEGNFGISVPDIPQEKQCGQFGSEWHSMDQSGNCFNSGMTEYLTARGVLKGCAESPVYGCTMYSNDRSQPPAGQREQVWNSSGLRSWIRTDASPSRIDALKTACANVQSSQANIWMPEAGTPSSQDFGMPNPDKCARAAACTASQYFDGASCVAQSSNNTGAGAQAGCSSAGGAWDSASNYCKMPTSTGGWSQGTSTWDARTYPGDSTSCPGFAYSRYDRQGARYCQLNSKVSCQYFHPAYLTESNYTPAGCPIIEDAAQNQVSGGCSSELGSLLGSGCHSMGSAWFNGAMTIYVMPGGSVVRSCTTEPISGCSGSTQSAGGGCPSGQYRDGSGACIVSPPSCTQGQYWNGSSCVTSPGSTSGTSAQAGCTSTGGTWDSSSNYCVMPTTSTSCSYGQYWNGSSCVTSPGSTSGTSAQAGCTSSGGAWDSARNYCTMPNESSCPPGGWNGSACTYSSSCSSGQYWNGSSCVTSSSYSGSGYDYSSAQSGCASAGGTWDSASSYCRMPNSSSAGSSCTTGQYWNGSACVSSSQTGATDYSSAQSGCASAGGTWNSSSNYCVMPTTSTSCTTGQYWNGSSCVTSPSSSLDLKSLAFLCPSGHNWNGSYCTLAQPSGPESYIANALSAFKSLFGL